MTERNDDFPDQNRMGGNTERIPATPYKFSPEELRILQQCNKESFFQRSLPLSSILGAGVYFGVKAGYFKPNSSFGAIPKVVTAVVMGYFLGKVSYQWKCAEKFMQLPNSELGAMLRKRKNKGGFQESMGMDLTSPFGGSLSVDQKDVYSDHTPSTFTDLDTERPYDRGLDDIFRPSLDSSPPPLRDEDYTMPPSSSQSITSYEELRRRNREEYEQRRTKPYRSVVSPEEVPAALSPKDRDPNPDIPRDSWNTPKNKYGDVFEK